MRRTVELTKPGTPFMRILLVLSLVALVATWLCTAVLTGDATYFFATVKAVWFEIKPFLLGILVLLLKQQG
jgi:uncharacterized membrane protein YhdT